MVYVRYFLQWFNQMYGHLRHILIRLQPTRKYSGGAGVGSVYVCVWEGAEWVHVPVTCYQLSLRFKTLPLLHLFWVKTKIKSRQVHWQAVEIVEDDAASWDWRSPFGLLAFIDMESSFIDMDLSIWKEGFVPASSESASLGQSPILEDTCLLSHAVQYNQLQWIWVEQPGQRAPQVEERRWITARECRGGGRVGGKGACVCVCLLHVCVNLLHMSVGEGCGGGKSACLCVCLLHVCVRLLHVSVGGWCVGGESVCVCLFAYCTCVIAHPACVYAYCTFECVCACGRVVVCAFVCACTYLHLCRRLCVLWIASLGEDLPACVWYIMCLGTVPKW